jgi:hypothetical protein
MSDPGKLDKLDLKRWLTLAAITAAVSVIDFVATAVIPELESMGGSTNVMLALGLTLAIDFFRRLISPTNIVKPEDAPKIQVDTRKDENIPEPRVGIIDWVRAKLS